MCYTHHTKFVIDLTDSDVEEETMAWEFFRQNSIEDADVIYVSDDDEADD